MRPLSRDDLGLYKGNARWKVVFRIQGKGPPEWNRPTKNGSFPPGLSRRMSHLSRGGTQR